MYNYLSNYAETPSKSNLKITNHRTEYTPSSYYRTVTIFFSANSNSEKKIEQSPSQKYKTHYDNQLINTKIITELIRSMETGWKFNFDKIIRKKNSDNYRHKK